jgi:hypothetical protein
MTQTQKHTFFFQWNIPEDNQIIGRTDCYIDIIATWKTDNFYSSGKPMISIEGVNLSLYDCLKVKDWHKAHRDIEIIAQKHFEEMAREERINQARAVLALAENPIVERYQLAV